MATAPSIGGVEFDIIHGLPQIARFRVEVWEVPGLDGYGAMTLGKGNAEFDLVSIFYSANEDDNDGSADLIIAQSIALQGTAVNVVDDWRASSGGDPYGPCIVQKVDASNAKKRVIFEGDDSAIRVEIRWHLLNQQLPAT